MQPRKTPADYSIFNTGRSMVNPLKEAEIARQTGYPLYGISPENIPQANAYVPNDPRLRSQGPSLLDLLLMMGRSGLRQGTEESLTGNPRMFLR